jgi:hypothetical protein
MQCFAARGGGRIDFLLVLASAGLRLRSTSD